MRRLPLAILAAAVVVPPVLAGQPDPSRNLTCAPTEAVKAALAKVPRRDPDCDDPSSDCWLDKVRAAEALVEKYPFDVHVHRRYQDLVTARDGDVKAPPTAAALERYRRFLDQHPDDPLAHYLFARINDDRAEAEASLALDPIFPWPHGLLATLLVSQGSQASPGSPASAEASATAGKELEAFARLCPNRFDEVLRRDAQTGDPAVWRRLLPNARSAMLKGPPADQMLWYQMLWDHEFAAWPPAEHATVRRRLRDDLARIESWKRRGDESWWQLLQAGYKMLDDPPGLERIEAGYARRFPCSWHGVQRTIDPFVASRGGWEHIHDQTQEQWRDTYEQSGRWLKTCPDQYKYLSYHFEAATHLESFDDRGIVAEADRYLTAWERIGSEWSVYPSPYNEVATEFLSRGIEPKRALDLAHKAEASFAAERKKRDDWGLSEEQKKDYARFDLLIDFDALGIIAEAALASGHRDEAEAALAKADAIDERLTGKERSALSAPTQARSWRVHARLAESTKRSPDALAYWRLAVQHAATTSGPAPTTSGTTAPTTSGAAARYATNDKAALDRLWRSLGGTDAGFAAWMSAGTDTAKVAQAPDAPAAGAGTAAAGDAAGAKEAAATGASTTRGPAWESRDTPLPPFSLTDTTGRTWTLADLQGRTAFINVWATWCGPCKAEIPHLRELDTRLRGRDDVVLLSFNTDDSPGVVAPFVRAHQVTWPVLFAADYFGNLPGGESGVPQNWVVDGAGVRRRVQLGFGGSDDWLAAALAAIDDSKTAPPPSH